MKPFFLQTLIAIAFLLLASANPQTGNHHFPTPPEPLDQKSQNEAPPTLTRHIDFAQAQKEADELASLAQTVPADVASMRKGMLPKDATEKLKQIEKLSKHLRTQLAP